MNMASTSCRKVMLCRFILRLIFLLGVAEVASHFLFELVVGAWADPFPKAGVAAVALVVMVVGPIFLFGRALARDVEREFLDQRNVIASMAKALEAQMTAMEALTSTSEADHHGTIVAVNDRFCEETGYSREELLGQNHRGGVVWTFDSGQSEGLTRPHPEAQVA